MQRHVRDHDNRVSVIFLRYLFCARSEVRGLLSKLALGSRVAISNPGTREYTRRMHQSMSFSILHVSVLHVL